MFVKKFLDRSIYYLNLLLIIPFLVFNFFHKKKYKFVKIRRDTIGNSASELYLYTNIFKNKKKHLYFFDDEYICNDYLNLICKKNFNFNKFGHLVNRISNHIKFFKNFILIMPNWNNLYKFKPKINEFKITEEFKISKNFPFDNLKQKKLFNEFVKKYNLNDKPKIACLVVRDSYYKRNYSNNRKKNWNYHFYRNAKIDSYKMAVQYLLKEGYKVIKVGKGSNQKLNIKNKNYFDYSSSKYRNDFTDFYLFSRAKICITTGTGIDELATIYKIPTVDTNFFPISVIRTYQNQNVTIFKKIWNKKLKKFLSLSELIENKIFYFPELVKKDLKFIDSSPEEIYEATKELNNKINKKEDKIFKYKINQKKFWYVYSRSFKFKEIYKNDLLNLFKYTYNNRNIHGGGLSNYFLNKNSWILK